jgi:hypothetical protein
MVKQIGQVLVIHWKNGRTTKRYISGWSDIVDEREKYDNNPKVEDTELQYDL